ncbi:unnamed protein product [Discosporangium mesarthrocarpum]
MKANQFGEVVRYKGRLVALGFQQRECRDFHETFMPTHSAVLRITLAVAPAEDWELFHWDIAQIFISADVKENMCVRLCDGCSRCSGKILKLRKALYGTRQAGRAFRLHLACSEGT